MVIHFYKFEGTGNDFIMLDGRTTNYSFLTQTVIEHLCDRHFGIGADGLIILAPAEGTDFKMVYYNSDGRESSMCGNGGRCITAFANHLGLINNKAGFTAIDGPHQSIINTIGGRTWDVSLKMIDVEGVEQIGNDYYLNTGSPHYVRFVGNVDAVDVVAEGRTVRYNSRFAAEGTNVNFVAANNGIIDVRTYERGVEDETLSCGTGVTASAIAAYLSGIENNNNTYPIQTTGGNLRVHLLHQNGQFNNIWLSGPVKFVFEGEVEV